MMVEAEATEQTWIQLVAGGATAPTEEVVAAGLEAAKPFIKALCEAQARAGRRRPPSRSPSSRVFLDYQDDVYDAVEAAAETELAAALTIAGKQEREDALDELKAEVLDDARRAVRGPREGDRAAPSARSPRSCVRQRVLRDQVRIDGRGLADIRPLSAEVEVVPAGARLGAVRARRDPDPGRHHAEHAPDGAAARHAVAGDAQALHAQLQLPAVLDR